MSAKTAMKPAIEVNNMLILIHILFFYLPFSGLLFGGLYLVNRYVLSVNIPFWLSILTVAVFIVDMVMLVECKSTILMMFMFHMPL